MNRSCCPLQLRAKRTTNRSEYAFAGGHRKRVRVSRIVTAALAVSAIWRPACAVFHRLDARRDRQRQGFVGGAAPVQFGAAQQEAVQSSEQLPPRVAAACIARTCNRIPDPQLARATRRQQRSQLPRRWHRLRRHAKKSPPPIRPRSRARSPCQSRGARSRREVAVCRPSARPQRHPEAAPARRIDADELAALLKRAKGLLEIGDITSARLLLERAADAQEAEAALMLAGTYDPQVLGTRTCAASRPTPRRRETGTRRPPNSGRPMRRRRLGQITELGIYTSQISAEGTLCDV